MTKFTFEKCIFDQQATGQYAVTLNVSETAFGNRAISYVFDGCTINSTGRGINIIPGTETQAIGNAKPTVVISGNTFDPVSYTHLAGHFRRRGPAGRRPEERPGPDHLPLTLKPSPLGVRCAE